MDSTITKIIEELLGERDQDGPIHTAFEEAGAETLEGFTVFQPEDVKGAFYCTGLDGAPIKLKASILKKIELLLGWVHSHGVLTKNHWDALTPEEAFHQSNLKPPASPATNPTAATATNPSANLAEFKKGNKRSVADYKDFTKDQQW